MFDNISFEIENFEKKDFNNLIENYIQKQPNKRGEEWFQIDWQNLRINYFPNQKKIKVCNSIHKFYNSQIAGLGLVNHNDFTMNQVNETVNYLETAFNRSANEMKLLGRFEYGININTESVKPFDIIDRYQSIVTTATNSFNVMYLRNGKSTCKFCSFSHYTVKAYDKLKQMGVTGSNILRYELVHHSAIKTKQVFGKSNITVEDLIDTAIWDKCFRNIQNTYDSIRMIGFPSDGATLYAKTLCYSFSTLNKDYKHYLKKVMCELKVAHDTIKESSSNPHSMVRNKLTKNYQELVSK